MQEARIPTEEARIPSKVLSQVTPSKDIKKDIPPPPAVNPFSPLLQKDKSPYEIYQAEMAKQKAEEKARREKMVLDQQKLEYIQMLKREEMEKEKKRQRLLQEQKELQKLQQIRQQNQQILAQLELKKKAKELGGIYGGPVVVKHQPKEERIPLRVAKVDKVEEKAVAARDYDKPWIQAVKQHYEYDKIKKKIPRSKQKSRENNIAKAEVARLKDDSSDSSKDDKSKDIPKVFSKETSKDIPKDRQEWFENIQ
ncbi:MAG: hypothetical protein EBZ49_15745, partial [Proteobacteria bacterium]|nr:hypothetical protein [Pseudomonadota bacterium]